ncbi:MAG TPA: 3-phosphoshikimate 1-carboxyvinyltransferase [Candidatus Acidoferrum sp.]|nr:3-phosphoshikimate 1-carboxyvinyltransferase [Candidatus Acidoferrum sp.]
MPLPELIEIVPLKEPVCAEITVPGSKSITNRALILAALAEGEVTLTGALWSEDTQIMTEALQKLGFEIRVEQDPDEFCNRTITVKGLGDRIPNAGAGRKPLELFVGNAGTAARFLAAFVCLGEGLYHFSGAERMYERPQAALFKALRQLGYRIETEYGNDRLPAFIEGSGPASGGKCKVSIEKSSQFASALLLCAKTGGWEVKVEGENAEESPYVAMTSKMIEAFPHQGGKFQIEPDASSGSYFWAAGWLAKKSDYERSLNEALSKPGRKLQQGESLRLKPFPKSEVMVLMWPASHLQIDQDFTVFVGASSGTVPAEISRLHDLADSIMTAIVIAPFAGQPVKFTDLGRLRLQETERVKALRTELTKCGAKVIEEGDTLTVYPSQLHGAEIETYNDHRMAMCFAVSGLKVPGIKIINPACVKKTFPNFFQKLAMPPPKGLGATILDAASGRRLAIEELFAD